MIYYAKANGTPISSVNHKKNHQTFFKFFCDCFKAIKNIAFCHCPQAEDSMDVTWKTMKNWYPRKIRGEMKGIYGEFLKIIDNNDTRSVTKAVACFQILKFKANEKKQGFFKQKEYTPEKQKTPEEKADATWFFSIQDVLEERTLTCDLKADKNFIDELEFTNDSQFLVKTAVENRGIESVLSELRYDYRKNEFSGDIASYNVTRAGVRDLPEPIRKQLSDDPKKLHAHLRHKMKHIDYFFCL